MHDEGRAGERRYLFEESMAPLEASEHTVNNAATEGGMQARRNTS